MILKDTVFSDLQKERNMDINSRLKKVTDKVNDALDKTEIDDKFIEAVSGLYDTISEKYEESGIRDKAQDKAEEIYDRAVMKIKEAELDEKAQAAADALKLKAMQKADEAKGAAKDKASEFRERACMEMEIKGYEISEKAGELRKKD